MLAGLAECAGAGIERHLVGRRVHDGRIVPEDVLGAVAVVDVEIDDGDALDAVRRLRVPGGDRRVVEEAEAHRRRRLGVVAGRPCGDEGVVDAAHDDLVDGECRSAGRAQSRFEGAGRHRRVGIELDRALGRAGALDRLDVVERMDPG